MAEQDQQTELTKAAVSMPCGIVAFPIMYVVILVALLAFWSPIDVYLRKTLTIPLIIPFFGLLGGLIDSLQGIFLHNKEWKTSFTIWHGFSGFVGAVYGLVSFLFLKGILKTPFDPFFYALAAFTLGYAQYNFQAFMSKIFSIVFQSPHADAAIAEPLPNRQKSPKT